MANLNPVVQDELTLIEICQRMLIAPSKAALTQIEKRLSDRAFAELLSRYNRWIWKQIKSIPRLDPDDAYSAALEGFQKAIATFDLTSGNALASWAKHCVRGALGTVLRNQQGQAARVEKLKATNTTLVYEDDLRDPYEEEQLHQCVEKLHQASSLLSETAQQIVLKRNEGMKFRAIGAELGKSADAVRMAYNRAITALGGMLTQQPESVVITQPESVVTTHKPPTVLQEEQLQSTFQAPENNWMKSLWERCKLNVRSFERAPILSRTVRGKLMTKQLSSSTRPFINKLRNTLELSGNKLKNP
jgi:RNA polymerase sigma-70 factor (ECF subfamily)